MTTAVIDDKELLIRCRCGDRIQHVAWLTYQVDKSIGSNLIGDVQVPEEYWDDWLLMVSLDPRFGFFRRLAVAFKYLFKPSDVRYAGFAELVLDNNDVERIAEFICRHRGVSVDGAGVVVPAKIQAISGLAQR